MHTKRHEAVGSFVPVGVVSWIVSSLFFLCNLVLDSTACLSRAGDVATTRPAEAGDTDTGALPGGRIQSQNNPLILSGALAESVAVLLRNRNGSPGIQIHRHLHLL